MVHCQEKEKKQWSLNWHATVSNVVAPYERKLDLLKPAHLCNYTVLRDWPYNMPVLSGVNHERAWRSCMPFNMILNNPFIPFSYDCRWNSTSSIGDITERWFTLSILNDSALSNTDTCWNAFLIIIQDTTRYSEKFLILQRAFQMRIPTHNFSFIQCFRFRFSHLGCLIPQNYCTLKKCLLLKIENNLSWVIFTHFREKTYLLALELIFVSSNWRVYMYIKFDI